MIFKNSGRVFRTAVSTTVKCITVDEAFDLVEAEINKVKASQKEYAIASVKGDTYHTSEIMSGYNDRLALLNSVWEFLKKDNAEVYYYDHREYPISKCLSKERKVKVQYTDIDQDTNTAMAQYRIITDYVQLDCLLDGTKQIVATDISSEQRVKDALENLSEVRRFTCKVCGLPTYANKNEDSWYISNGLQPTKKCDTCRLIKVENAPTKTANRNGKRYETNC